MRFPRPVLIHVLPCLNSSMDYIFSLNIELQNHCLLEANKIRNAISQFVMFNLDCLMLIPCCFNKNNTDSLSVAPVRYPVVQISSKLHIMKQNRKRNKENSKERKPLNLEELK